jgi:hypothetical protein
MKAVNLSILFIFCLIVVAVGPDLIKLAGVIGVVVLGFMDEYFSRRPYLSQSSIERLATLEEKMSKIKESSIDVGKVEEIESRVQSLENNRGIF